MDIPHQENFEHEGKIFVINVFSEQDKYKVVAELNGQEETPRYTVEIITHQDYFIRYKSDLLKNLIDIAKSDIEHGRYFKG